MAINRTVNLAPRVVRLLVAAAVAVLCFRSVPAAALEPDDMDGARKVYFACLKDAFIESVPKRTLEEAELSADDALALCEGDADAYFQALDLNSISDPGAVVTAVRREAREALAAVAREWAEGDRRKLQEDEKQAGKK